MEPKDFGIMDKLNSNLEKDSFDEKEFSSENQKKKIKFGSKIFKVLEEVPFSWFGIAFLILIILLFFFISRNGVDDKQVAIEARLKKLEDRIATVEIANIYITKIWEEAKTFEQFKERFNRSEASMTMRMNNIIVGQDKLQIKMAETSPKNPGPAKLQKFQGKPQRRIITQSGLVSHFMSSAAGMV